MARFENVFVVNHTPFSDKFIASISRVWKENKTLGVDCVFCKCIKYSKRNDSHIVFLTFFAKRKEDKWKSDLVASETLNLSHCDSEQQSGKSISYEYK